MPRVFWRAPLARLSLPVALRAAILEHAQATPAAEVCGLLGGRGDLVVSRYPIANVATEPADTFEMDAREQLAAFKTMRERGEALSGIYHSHPAGPAEPSARDLEWAAYPGVPYLIVSLATPGVPVLAGFVFDGGAFQPLVLSTAA